MTLSEREIEFLARELERPLTKLEEVLHKFLSSYDRLILSSNLM
jgi:hypothetical protein